MSHDQCAGSPRYDRSLLLGGSKRNQVLTLADVEKYGVDSFSDSNYICLYGLKPSEWYARGVRVLGRTAVECTRDCLADAIGADVASVAKTVAVGPQCLVLDPFAGSGNTLFWIQRHLRDARALGFERDDTVYEMTKNNFSTLSIDIELVHDDYQSGIRNLTVPPSRLIIAFVAPPWGNALRDDNGLDLGRTEPPIIEIVQYLRNAFEDNTFLFAIQVFEKLDVRSVSDLRGLFDWSDLRLYAFNAPGYNHGILLATSGWQP